MYQTNQILPNFILPLSEQNVSLRIVVMCISARQVFSDFTASGSLLLGLVDFPA